MGYSLTQPIGQHCDQNIINATVSAYYTIQMFFVLFMKIIKGLSLPIIKCTIISETIIYEDCLYIYPHYDITFCWVKLTVWPSYAFGSWLVDAVYTTASFVDWSIDAISSCFIEHTSVTMGFHKNPWCDKLKSVSSASQICSRKEPIFEIWSVIIPWHRLPYLPKIFAKVGIIPPLHNIIFHSVWAYNI